MASIVAHLFGGGKPEATADANPASLKSEAEKVLGEGTASVPKEVWDRVFGKADKPITRQKTAIKATRFEP